jgi:hypothetical protein
VGRATVLVGRVPSLGDHALPALPLCALPGFWIVQSLHQPQWRFQRQTREKRATSLERHERQVTAIEPQDVEEVVTQFSAPVPNAECFAIEDHVVHG